MEGIFSKSDFVAQNPFEELAEALEDTQNEFVALEKAISQRIICRKITYIALGVFAFIAGTALLVTGLVLIKAVFPLGIFAAAAIPLTAAVKAQVAGYFAMMFAGLGLQGASVFSFKEASSY